MVRKFNVRNPLKSIFKNVGAILGIPKPELKSGSTLNIPSSALGRYNPVSSQSIPSAQVIKIPHKIFPLMFFTKSTAVIKIPINARSTVIPSEEKFPDFIEAVKE